jgi:hypothetical protein
MAAKARRKLTITVEDAVHRGLYKIIGPRNIDDGYRAMADDEEREAPEWSEELVGDVGDEPRR